MRLRQLTPRHTFCHNGTRYLKLGRTYRTLGEKATPLGSQQRGWTKNKQGQYKEKLSGEIVDDYTFAARIIDGKLDLVRFQSGTLVDDTGPPKRKNQQLSPAMAKTHAEYLENPPSMLAWFKYRDENGDIVERRELANAAQILDIIKPLVAEKRLLDFTEYKLDELDNEQSERKQNRSAARKLQMGREIAQLILAFAG